MTEPVQHIPPMARVAIVGAGAIGLWIGVRLAQAGCQVSALARGATLSALREHGMRLQSGQAEQVCAVQARSQARDLGGQDRVAGLSTPLTPPTYLPGSICVGSW